MKRISRRIFLKTAAVIGATSAVGRYIVSGKFGKTILSDPVEAAPTDAEKVVTVVADFDAHSQCMMRVKVKGNKVVEVKGNPADPESKGELTMRGKHMMDILYAPDRLKYPMKRIGKKGEGKWKRISWDEALTTISNRLNKTKGKYGAEAINFHHGFYHSGDTNGSYLARLANLIGTPNVSNPSHVCHVPRVFLQFKFGLGAVVPPDVAHTSCLIIWAGNPKATNKPMAIAIKEARDRGAKLIVIDPRVTSYAKEADIHAQLRPGTDCALALGMLNVIIKEGLYDKEFVKKWTIGFEELKKHVEDYPPKKVEKITWVPAETIRRMARMYANTKPACISPRNAIEHHTNASGTIRAISILMAITGNLDVKGGNVIAIPIMLGLEDINLYEKLPPEAAKKKIGADKYLRSKITKIWPATHTPSVWDAIIHGKPYHVKSMLVVASNPVLSCANSKVVERALKKLDFLAVADIFMTPTASLADIVLPACTFLERTRFVTYDTHADHGWNAPSRIALSPKVVEPLGESWSDWKIISEIGRKMGYSKYFPWKTEEEALNHILKPLGVTCEELRDKPEGVTIPIPPILYKKFSGFSGSIIRGILEITMFRNYPDMYKKYEGFMKGFFTQSKKVNLYSKQLEEYGYDPLPVYREPAESPVSRPHLARRYPLVLIAGSKLEAYTHSMMRNIPALRKQCPNNRLEINPKTAAKLNIRNGNAVRVESPRGRISCSAYVTARIDPRVVHLHYGFKESNSNILTDHKACDPIIGSTGLKSLLCNVKKV